MAWKFSPYLYGFKKNHNSQHMLLKMSEVWKKYLDKRDLVGVILKDLSKTFDTINHSLQLAYGFSLTSLKIMQSQLYKWFQRTTINGFFSNCTDIMTGVPQGSILRVSCTDL